MPVNPILTFSALLFGTMAGWVAGLWIDRQLAGLPRNTPDSGSIPDNGEARFIAQAAPRGRCALRPWAHGILLGATAGALTFLPPLQEARPLSQVLLFLFVAYPLAWIDVWTLTVEPALVLLGMVLRGVSIALMVPGQAQEAVVGMIAGAGLLYLVAFAYREVRGRDGLGEGDPAVMGLIGAFVGVPGLLPVLLLASALGLLVGGGMLLSLRKSLQTPLPFVPFLLLAGLAVLVTQTLNGTPALEFLPWG